MTRTSQTRTIQKILGNAPFKVKQRAGRYIFERTENDGKFIPDYQILPTFESAVRWARNIKSLYI